MTNLLGRMNLLTYSNKLKQETIKCDWNAFRTETIVSASELQSCISKYEYHKEYLERAYPYLTELFISIRNKYFLQKLRCGT